MCCVTLISVSSTLINFNVKRFILILLERANFIKTRESSISIIYQVKPSFNIQIIGVYRRRVDWVDRPFLSQHYTIRKALLQCLVLLSSVQLIGSVSDSLWMKQKKPLRLFLKFFYLWFLLKLLQKCNKAYFSKVGG